LENFDAEEDINKAWGNYQRESKFQWRVSGLLWIEEAYAIVRRMMLQVIT
jgi:hypothetical protein